MKNILIHGLGQTYESFNTTKKHLNSNGIDVLVPDLFKLNNTDYMSYKNLYESFADYCNKQDETLNLCGISLGGILALDYAKQYPKKLNSIIIIGTPYKIPKILFLIQSIIFHIMPKSTFEKMGCSKKEFISLVNSMKNLNIANDLETISCKSLILCGAKDNANMKSAKLLNKSIKDSEFKIISNSSHEVNIDNPKELATVIYDFLRL